ncbi:hypothetical protein BB561_001778 [Smittium simulii]|uniref:Fructose-bisphosphate aldolase n=1 Tax=Smittium simulii TaxID=133385 RepID=A0A2T9YT44_9FUNG|nr:hypothetical protein BB561_001778 [Smittium simulii]
MGLLDIVPAGVVTGKKLMDLFHYCQKHNFAIPAVNCTSSSTVNACLETARDTNTPIIVQVSHGGAAFFAGKGIKNTNDQASITGAIAAAHHVRAVAKIYGVPVVLHSDHCARNILGWLDGMIEADEAYYKQHGEPLFSSHMIDLSAEEKSYNIEVTAQYMKRLAAIDCLLEMEIGLTGGEEDGVNNEDVDNASLYTQPEDVYDVYTALKPIGDMFTIAAAFGNVHGVYKPGNVKLQPILLKHHQEYLKSKIGGSDDKPLLLVFHGGSGSTKEEVREAVSYGVVKMNVDTDTQWAYLIGVRDYVINKSAYITSQVGNPDGDDKPNKKYYDPRVWIREGELTMIQRIKEANSDLGNINTL